MYPQFKQTKKINVIQLSIVARKRANQNIAPANHCQEKEDKSCTKSNNRPPAKDILAYVDLAGLTEVNGETSN